MKDAETLARIAEDTAAIRACVERMEAQGGMKASAPALPTSLPSQRLAKFRFYRDVELREFVMERLQEGSSELTALHTAAVERFGKDRVPGRSSLHRFYIALQGEVRSRR